MEQIKKILVANRGEIAIRSFSCMYRIEDSNGWNLFNRR